MMFVSDRALDWPSPKGIRFLIVTPVRGTYRFRMLSPRNKVGYPQLAIHGNASGSDRRSFTGQ